MSDIALLIIDDLITPVISKGDLTKEEALQTAVLISLFTDRRVSDEELPQGERSKRGWWGDMFPDVDQDFIGSKLWTLEREKTTEMTRLKAEQYAEEALAWILEDGIAEEVQVSAAYDENKRLIISVLLSRPQGESRFSVLWDRQQGVRRY